MEAQEKSRKGNKKALLVTAHFLGEIPERKLRNVNNELQYSLKYFAKKEIVYYVPRHTMRVIA